MWRGDLIRAAGFIYPPCTWHAYGDDFWESIGRDYACWTVLMDVIVEHRHPFKNPILKDITHARSYDRMAEDKAELTAWRRNEMDSAIRRIMALKASQTEPQRKVANA